MKTILISEDELRQIVEESCTKAIEKARLGSNETAQAEATWGNRNEAANLMKVSLPTIHSMMRKGLLEYRKVGPRRTLINLTKLRGDIASGRLGRYVHALTR